MAVHAGGAIVAPAGRWTAPAGAALAGTLVDHDTTLAGRDAERYFAAYFGLDKAAWTRQSRVKRVECPTDCSSALAAAVAESADEALLWVDGDVSLRVPLVLGSTLRPVVLVANGTVQVQGPVTWSGLVYASGLRWDAAPSGALLRGAVILESDYRGSAAADIVYDAQVLARLKGSSGSFARVNGSWRDF
jgi:hypothetical protein